MTFYILFLLLITLLLVFGYLYPQNGKVFDMSLLLIAITISGFRDYLSGDYRAYVEWYYSKTRDFDFEFGFVWLMDVLRWFHCSHYFLFFFFSVSSVTLVFLGVKKYTKHSTLAFFFYLLIPVLYLNSWSIIRQTFTMSIAFYAFHFLISKKYFYFALLMGIAISFHKTAIIILLVFIVIFKVADTIKTVHLIVLLLISLILSQIHWVSFFSGLFVNTHYLDYFKKGYIASSTLKITVLNGLAIFLLFYYEKMKTAYPNQKYLMLLYFFSVFVTNLFASINDLTRLAYYFTIFEIVVFADLIFLELKNRRLLFFSGFYIYGVVFFIYTLKVDYNLNSQNTKYIPYNCVFYKFDDPFFMIGTDYLTHTADKQKY